MTRAVRMTIAASLTYAVSGAAVAQPVMENLGRGPYPNPKASPFSGQGNHSLAIADVDTDGRDEIVYGAMVVDDNGKGLFSTGLRHGDALHAGDLDPARPGLEVFGIHENEEALVRASLRIYTTIIPATSRLETLMHDRTYRLAIAWQNVGYNQPPHPGFFLGHGMRPPPRPRIAVPRRSSFE